MEIHKIDPWMKKVDSEVGVVALNRLGHVLDDADVEGHRHAEDRQDDGLVLLVWLPKKTMKNKSRDFFQDFYTRFRARSEAYSFFACFTSGGP
jgi:hypothetical protein